MRIPLTILSVPVLALAATACSGEDAVESLIENAVERESGEDVDIDFSDGDGFSIETDEGSMTVDEDGNFVITDADGQVVTGDVDVDGDGVDISTEDGSFSMESDDDGGFTMETEDGSISMESDEDGGFTMETEDGTITSGATTELPGEWPDSVPEPSGFTIDSSTQFSDGDTSSVSVTGTSENGGEWAESYGATLVAAGFAELSKLSTPESVFAGYETSGMNISVQTIDNGDGSWFVTVVASNTGEG